MKKIVNLLLIAVLVLQLSLPMQIEAIDKENSNILEITLNEDIDKTYTVLEDYNNPDNKIELLKNDKIELTNIIKYESLEGINYFEVNLIREEETQKVYLQIKDLEKLVEEPFIIEKDGLELEKDDLAGLFEEVELEENNSTDETEELEANEVDQDLEEVEEELTDEADEVEEQVVETRQLITTLRGVALKAPTAVRQSKNQASKALKTYSKGHILIYREAPGDWYEATVYLNGKPTKGYIYKSDVENITPNGKHLNGFSTKVPLNVYKKADRASGHWKSYGYGSKLIYKEFSKNWYEATVYVSGKAQTGYIHKSDVSASEPGALKPIFGYGQVNPTRVYERTSKKSKTLKSYKRGSRLKYEDYDGTWYKATVYLKGKPVTGYIHKNDVNLNKPAQVVTINGYGHASPTRVYQKTNKNSRVLKSYKKGSKLKYQKYNGTWYKATVYLNGKPQTGYIHKNDVNVNQPSFFGYGLKAPTAVYSSTSLSSTKLKTYSKGTRLKYQEYNANWYKATVYLNGKARTGYINKSHVGSRTKVSYVNPNRTYTYSQMTKDIKDLKKAYPDLIDYKVVGKSEYGRDIYAVSLGKGKSTAFVNGSLHAREWISSTLNMYMLEQYAKGYADNRTIRGFNVRKTLNDTTLWFMPMVNPDGVTLQQFGLNSFPKSDRNALKRMNNGSTNFKRWKSNAKGIDVNRNFSAGWNNVRNDPGKPWHQNYKGPRPMSTKEAQAISKFVKDIKPKMSINYHSSGQVIYWNYNQKGSTYNRDRIRARQISNYTGYTLMGGSRPAGGFMEWFGMNMGGTAITPELAPYAGNTNPPVSRFAQIWRENQPVGLYAASQSR